MKKKRLSEDDPLPSKKVTVKTETVEVCSNCGNIIPTVPKDQTPYQFCSKICKEQYQLLDAEK